MSGMDRLTDEALEALESGRSTESVLGCGCEVILVPLARELLAHRRALQDSAWEADMEDLAKKAAAQGVSRSSFAQAAEACHDEVLK